MKILVIATAMLIAAPTYAQSGATTSSQPAGSGATVIEPIKEKLICKKQEVIGSLIAKKRVCATAANWERNEARAKEHLKILTEPGAFAPSG